MTPSPAPRQKARKSIRTILVVCLLLFSVLPVAAITIYSLLKYEQAIDQELSTRLSGNAREISVILGEFQNGLLAESRQVANDKALAYYLGANNIPQSRAMLTRWFGGSVAHRIWVFNRDARLSVALYRDDKKIVRRREGLENVVEIGEPLLKALEQRDDLLLFDIGRDVGGKGKAAPKARMELSIFAKIKNAHGGLIGYVEEALTLDESVLRNIRNRLGAEIFFFQPGKPLIVATNDDLAAYQSYVFAPHLREDGFFEFNLRGNPYRVMLKELKWGDNSFALGLGVSKSAARAVLKNVNVAFFGVVLAVVVLLIGLSIVASRWLLTPIYDVLNAIEGADFEKGQVQVPTGNETELGLLAEGFNRLAARTYESQSALKSKIQELEGAQAKLVHTAKMASLGQLVAGVAHELNNPIGFIYSNMGHLRDYSDKLLHLIEVAEHQPKKLKQEKEKADLEYIVKDLPKLIGSCEDGARRTRDIVLGLRNFSRLEEAQVKDVDLHQGLDNTLSLLGGELKNRVKVTKNYGRLPKVRCYASQVNQVFMNVLSNAAQSIDQQGAIEITTQLLEADGRAAGGGERVEISIRDTGKGMSTATLEKIFDPFFTTKGLGSGTGLGLSISYGIVEKHGGEILVTSEVGVGTEFRILLPVHGAGEVPSAPV